MSNSGSLVIRALNWLAEQGIEVSRNAVEIVRKTKNGFSMYTSNYIIIANVEQHKILIRSNHYLEPKSSNRKQSRRKEVGYLEPESEPGWV